jgi:hypothetical protein
MKVMKNIYKILILAFVAIVAGGCTDAYDKLPPKTDASVQYALPYPEKPSQSEIDNLLQMRAEHNNAIK